MTDSLIPRDKLDTISAAFRAHRDSMDLLEKAVATSNRERIAELERDLAHALASQSQVTARTIIAFCNEEVPFSALGNSHVETAVKQLHRRLLEVRAEADHLRKLLAEERGNITGSPKFVARHIGDLPTTATEVAPLLTPAVVEEQGPWVIYDEDHRPSNDLPWAGACPVERFPWGLLCNVLPFEKKEDAERQIAARPSRYSTSRVITLAEARAIAGAK